MAPSALPLLLMAVAATLLSSAAAQVVYTGATSFSVQDTNPGHTMAACTTKTGCVPLTVALTATGAVGIAFKLHLPSGALLATGKFDSNGAASAKLVLPWGKYPVSLTIGTVVVSLSFTVTGFEELDLPKANAFASDAKMGLYGDLRWSYYALQKNNSIFTPGVEQQFWTGSATHYHQHCYWHLALDPANTNKRELLSFVVIVFPYFSNGKPNYDGSLLNQYPSRTTNKNFNVSMGDAPFYTGPARKACTLVGTNPTTPNWPANTIWKCDPAFLGRFLVATATQMVDPNQKPTNASLDDRATKLALHYVRAYAPLYPTYAANTP